MISFLTLIQKRILLGSYSVSSLLAFLSVLEISVESYTVRAGEALCFVKSSAVPVTKAGDLPCFVLKLHVAI